jgi:hypothetical protein
MTRGDASGVDVTGDIRDSRGGCRSSAAHTHSARAAANRPRPRAWIGELRVRVHARRFALMRLGFDFENPS